MAILSGNVKEGKQDIFPEDSQFVHYLNHQYITCFTVAWIGGFTSD